MSTFPEEMGMDLVLTNGNVITLGAEDAVAQAVAIKNGRIIEVGTTEAIKGMASKKTRIIDLQGKAVLPGFIDAHVHPVHLGLFLTYQVDCSSPPIKSIAEIKEKIKEKVEMTPEGQWIRGHSYDDIKLKEKRHPTRWDLDEITPENPAVLCRVCGHISVFNSKALESLGITKDTPDPSGGRIVKEPKTGEPTGLVLETAHFDLLQRIPPYSKEQIKEAIRVACWRFSEWGITTIHDALATPEDVSAYQQLLADNQLPIRVGLMISTMHSEILPSLLNLGLHTGFGSERLKITGVKFFIDGVIGGRTAALYEPYVGETKELGFLSMKPEELNVSVKKALNGGLRPCIHAIGDRAIDTVLDAVEASLKENPVKDHRCRIEHCGVCPPKLLERLKRLDVIVVPQSQELHTSGDSWKSNLDEERIKWFYPFKSFLEYGIVAAVGSDSPYTSASPMLGIYFHVTRKTESGAELAAEAQGISVKESLRMYTINGAYAGFEENVKGSIEKGKLADLTILSADPLNTAVEKIRDIEVEMTIVDGEIVYCQQE